MANTKPAVGTATKSAVNSDWLNVDTSAAERGEGPAEYGYPSPGPGAPTVPTGTNPFAAGIPDYSPDSDTYQVDSEGEGAWPSVPDSYNAWNAPIQRGYGAEQGLYETTLPSEGDYGYSGAWGTVEPLQTYDYVSQQVNEQGWIQNIPNNRTSSRNTWGQANPLNNPTWYPYGENAARTRPAIVSAPFTADSGQFGVIGASYGELPSWAMTGGQGNTSYDTPGPPATSSANSSQSYQSDPGSRFA